MILTQSLEVFLFERYPKLLPLIGFGHTELMSEEIIKEYLDWCRTDEGRSYLKGGENYREDHPGAAR